MPENIPDDISGSLKNKCPQTPQGLLTYTYTHMASPLNEGLPWLLPLSIDCFQVQVERLVDSREILAQIRRNTVR